MYQYASKDKAQSEKSKANTPATNKNHAQMTTKMSVKTKSFFSPSFNQENAKEKFISNQVSHPVQLMPKHEEREIQPLPIELSETQKQLQPASIKLNNTGIPIQMKERFENLSGFSFDDVRVHYNSDKPTQLQALAYTKGNHVYIGSGQEKHLEHELGHVVQQKRGIVRPTGHVGDEAINDDEVLEQEASNISLSIVNLDGWRSETNVSQRMKFKHAVDPQTNVQGIDARIAQIYPTLDKSKRNTLADALDAVPDDLYESQIFYCKFSFSTSIKIGTSNHITLGDYTVFYTGKGGKRNIHAIGKHKGSSMYEILAFATESPFCSLFNNWDKVKATMPKSLQTPKPFEIGMTVGFHP